MNQKYGQFIRPGMVCALMLLLVFPVACGENGEVVELSSPPAPTATSRTAPVGMLTAHRAALNHIASHLAHDLPQSDADWTIYNITEADVIGRTTYRLKSGSCLMTISYPLTAPEATIYHVVVDDPAADFYWEGDIDAQGEVVIRPFDVGEETAVINLVDLADLRSTTRIEICELDWACYTPLLTINDTETITALVDALDTDLPLVTHAQCPAVYQIRFVLADDESHTFGYTCEMKTPVFLRGSQDFWNGQDGIAPDAFNEILLPLLTPVSGG